MVHPQQERLLKAATQSGITTEDLSAAWGQDAVRYSQGGKNEVIFEGNGLGSATVLATAICNDLLVSRHYLQQLGIPVPKGKVIKLEEPSADKSQLLEMLGEFWEEGKPYSARPAFESGGHGVASHLTAITDLEIHLDRFADEYATWLVEVPVEGEDLQLLVVGGKLVSAILRSPLKLQGNGQLTLEEMIATHNAHASASDVVEIDADTRQLLREQAIYLSELVPNGQWVQLKNAAAGAGGAKEVTNGLHSRYADWAAQIAREIGLAFFSISCKTSDSKNDPAQATSVLALQSRPQWTAFEDADGATVDMGKLILSSVFGS
jgi:hypothetical protein